MAEKSVISAGDILGDWRSAQDQVSDAKSGLAVEEEQLKGYQQSIRGGEFTTGDEVADFLFGSSNLEQLQDFDSLYGKCMAISELVGRNSGKLVLKISGNANGYHSYNFGILPETAGVKFGFVLGPGQFNSYNDYLAIPTEGQTTWDSNNRHTSGGSRIALSRGDLDRYKSESELSEQDQESEGQYVRLLFGNDQIVIWFVNYSKEGLEGYYENCHRIGLHPELPPRIAEEFQKKARSIGGYLVTRLVSTNPGDKRFLEGELESVKATGISAKKAIKLAAAAAINKLPRQK